MLETPFTDLMITKDGRLKKGTRNGVEKRQESHERVVKGDIFKETVAWAKELGFSGRALQEPDGGLVDQEERGRVNNFTDRIRIVYDKLGRQNPIHMEETLRYSALGKLYLDGKRMYKDALPGAFNVPADLTNRLDQSKWYSALAAEFVYQNSLRDPYSRAEIPVDGDITVEVLPKTHFAPILSGLSEAEEVSQVQKLNEAFSRLGAQPRKGDNRYPAPVLVLKTSLMDAVRGIATTYSYPSPHQK